MKQPQPIEYPQPASVRRKLVEQFRKRSRESRWTDAERAEFARLADMWAATLPPKKK